MFTQPTKAQLTAQRVRVVQQFAGSARRPVPKFQPPSAIERDYATAIRMMVVRTLVAFEPLFAELPAMFDRAKAARMDAFDDGSRVHALIAEARARIFGDADHPDPLMKASDVAGVVRRYALRVDTHGAAQLARQVKAALGADVAPQTPRIAKMVDAYVAENVTIILAIPAKLLTDVEKDVTRALTAMRIDRRRDADDTIQASPYEPPRALANVLGIRNVPAGTNLEALARSIERNVERGGTTKNLARVLRERFGFASDHAKLVARDQVGKLVGQTNAYRQQQLGITSFTWRTSGDERVREEHQARDGQVYQYDDPPDGELPGEPINCRCSAEPVFDDVVNAVDEDQIPESDDDITSEDGVDRVVSAQDLLDRGYYQFPNLSASKLRNAKTIVEKGLKPADKGTGVRPIKILVGNTGRLEVDDGRHRLAAAIARGETKIPVRFVAGGKSVGRGKGVVKVTAKKPPVATEV